MKPEIEREEREEKRWRSWGRRAVTIPGLFVLFAVDLALLPVLIVGAAVMDVAKRRPFVAVRFHLAVAFALGVHVLALVLLAGTWVAGLRWAGASPERQRRLDAWIEGWLGRQIWRSAMALFGMRLVVEGEEALEPGPIVLMSRHTSILDPLLPTLLMRKRPKVAFRFVVKRELLWDPGVDILGHRLPHTFVQRGGPDHAREIARVIRLARNLRPEDVVVIFPEGTRFTEEKQARILAKLAATDPEAHARAQKLRHLLPPHPGGPLGLLEHTRDTDVVFCAHTGLEGANHLRDLAHGSLVGATVHVKLWRVPAECVPPTAHGRREWLDAWWSEIDEWLDAHPLRRAAQARKQAGTGRRSRGVSGVRGGRAGQPLAGDGVGPIGTAVASPR